MSMQKLTKGYEHMSCNDAEPHNHTSTAPVEVENGEVVSDGWGGDMKKKGEES